MLKEYVFGLPIVHYQWKIWRFFNYQCLERGWYICRILWRLL